MTCPDVQSDPGLTLKRAHSGPVVELSRLPLETGAFNSYITTTTPARTDSVASTA